MPTQKNSFSNCDQSDGKSHQSTDKGIVDSRNDGNAEPSNETIVTGAYERLDRHPHFRGRTRKIQILCEHSVLILRGRLPSFYLKQLLQTALRELDGVSNIRNHVEVLHPNDVLNCRELSNEKEKSNVKNQDRDQK